MTETGSPGVPVTVNGRHFTLKHTFSTMVRFEKITGMSMMGLTQERFGFMVVVGLFWSGLGTQMPGLTFEGAAEMLQAHVDAGQSLAPVIDAINEALDNSGLLTAMTQGNVPGPGASDSGNAGS